jgi:hypothetical protein
MFVGMLCLIYCLWIVMMAHKSKNFSSLSSSSLICAFHSFFSLGKVIFLVVITRWCSIWKFTSTSHSPSFIIYIYINICICLRVAVTSNCPFILLILTGATERIFVSNKWWSTLVIYTQMICVRDEREREREKSPKKMWWYASQELHLFFFFFSAIDRSSNMYNV